MCPLEISNGVLLSTGTYADRQFRIHNIRRISPRCAGCNSPVHTIYGASLNVVPVATLQYTQYTAHLSTLCRLQLPVHTIYGTSLHVVPVATLQYTQHTAHLSTLCRLQLSSTHNIRHISPRCAGCNSPVHTIYGTSLHVVPVAALQYTQCQHICASPKSEGRRGGLLQDVHI